MWDLKKAILLTNNSRVQDKYRNQIQVVFLTSYEDVLIKARDMVYDRHMLLTHPQASSLKPNQTPYRSVIVYPQEHNDNTESILLIEKCLETWQHWQDIAPTPESYSEKVSEDFKTIDLSVVDAVMERLQ